MSRALWLVPLSCVLCSFASRFESVATRESRVYNAGRDDYDKQKEAAVRRVLAATHAADMGKVVMKRMMEQLGKLQSLPPGFVDRILQEVDPDEMVELIVPIYKQHYDLETLNGLATFYESPVGKKYVAEQPAVASESVAAGMKWGQDIAKRVTDAMEKEKKEKK
jgi:hypothetical protein